MAAGINLMLWHEVTAGICQLQVQLPHSTTPCILECCSAFSSHHYVNPSVVNPAVAIAAAAISCACRL